MKLAFVRLGRDSTGIMANLNALPSGRPNPAIQIQVTANQVSDDVKQGHYAAIWLGSHNNKGLPTPWRQGLRAFGRVTNRTGTRQGQSTLTIDIAYIIPESTDQMDFLRYSPTAFYWFAHMPIVGITSSANQAIQVVHSNERQQQPGALFYALDRIDPNFRTDVCDRYPELSPLFDYIPLNPEGSGRPGVTSLPDLSDEPDEAIFEALVSLNKGRPVILKGPPGTSKSYSARQIARILTGNDPSRVRCIQFHSAWSYEDFVEGQRVTTSAGNMVIDPVPKVFKELCLEAINHPEPRVLIIDEINRADVNRVFGEVLSNIEYRDSPAQLLYSGEDLIVPENLHIIGTMNDWDRSTVDLDFAFLRRFDEIELKPSVRGLRQVLGAASGQATSLALVTAAVVLFQEIARVYPPGVGHAFFNGVTEIGDLERLWRRTIRPTLLRREGVLPGSLAADLPQGISNLDAFVAQQVVVAVNDAEENGGNEQ